MGCGTSKSIHVQNSAELLEPKREESCAIQSTEHQSDVNSVLHLNEEEHQKVLQKGNRLEPLSCAPVLPDLLLHAADPVIVKSPSRNESKMQCTDANFGDNVAHAPVEKSEVIPQKDDKKRANYNEWWEKPAENLKKEVRERLNNLIGLDDYKADKCTADLEFLAALTRKAKPEFRSVKKACIDEMVKSNLTTVWVKVFEQNFTDQMFCAGEEPYNNMKMALVLMWNGTDASLALCQELEKKEYYKVILQYLDHPLLEPQEVENAKAIYLAKGFFGILHNLIQSCDLREAYRSASAVRIFSKFRNSKNLMLKCKAEFNLAYVLNEDENAQLNANAENIKFMEKILSVAMKTKDHYSVKYGYRVGEVVSCLNKLAANDDNKVKMVEEGLLQHYAALLNPDTSTEAEQLLAAKGLWVLSFKVKDHIIREEGCMPGLKKLAEKGVSKEVQEAAKGALWILEGKDDSSFKEAVDHESRDQVSQQGHVMISYQWDTKPLLLKVRDRLRQAGHIVWMDVDNMSGSILEAMADAVEQASVVVICLSEKYKESPNCRTEAEYAYRLQKKIVPLLLQTRYRPDGWLGAIAGNRLYFDLSQEKKYEASMEKFMIELHRICGSGELQKTEQTSVTHALPPVMSHSAVDWSENKVADWLKDHALSNKVNTFTGIDGSLLLELKSMYHHAPEFFYTSLKDQMKFSLLDILKFTKAIKTIT